MSQLRFPSIALFLLLGCQSNPARDFEKLKPGMEKTDVLGVMGSPQRTQRWHGMDRWTYIYYEEKVDRREKEVHFAEGKAVYLGDTPVPAVSAEEQDRLYAAENLEIEKDMAKRREEFKTQLYIHMKEADSEEIGYVPKSENVEPGSTVKTNSSNPGSK